MNTLYLRIKELATERHESLAQIERDLKFSNGIISTWKNGRASSDKIEKIADHFDVSTDYLLGRTNDPKSSDSTLDKKEQDIVALFRKNTSDLNDEEKDAFNKSLNSLMQTAKSLLKNNND